MNLKRSTSVWRRRLAFLLFLVAMGVWVVDLIRFSSTLYVIPGDNYAGESVDVVAVLTGGQGRFKEAFSFLERKQGKVLFISGIDEGVKLEEILKANKVETPSSEYLGRIFVDRVSRSTLDNATEIRKIMEWLQAKSLLVVTSSYHMRRAMLMIQRELRAPPELDVRVYEWSVESPNFDRNLWWKSPIGWEIFMSEYFKSRADDLLRR